MVKLSGMSCRLQETERPSLCVIYQYVYLNSVKL